jgi:hypothetical protein
MTIGQLISFTTYLGMLIWPMLALGWFFNIVERGSASYARVSRLLEEDIEIRDREGGHEIERKDLSFHIRSFAYPNNPERIVLEDIRPAGGRPNPRHRRADRFGKDRIIAVIDPGF